LKFRPKKYIIQFILKPLLWIAGTAVAVSLVLWWFIPPAYNFSEPTAFSGTKWYNPYTTIDTNDLKLSNFQIQSKSYGGVTNGRNNSSERVFSTYKNLGYDVITISDYMKINHYKENSHPHVTVYEHGYGFFKNHQVCLGASEVTWLDFPLFQSQSSKQFVLNELKKKNKCVAIAHPSLRDAYSIDDMKVLRGYDLIEALSNYKNSLELWDAALSSGNPVFLIADDDAHNLDKPDDYGRVATVIHSKSSEEDSLIHALKHGDAYGLVVQTPDYDTHEKKAKRFKKLPQMLTHTVVNDSLFLSFSDSIQEVRAIGQDGALLLHLKLMNETSSFLFPLANVAHFVRFEVKLKDGSKIFTNPVFRSKDGTKPLALSAGIDIWASHFYRLLGLLVIGFSILRARNPNRFRRPVFSKRGTRIQA
jgi:hypothetical protein